MPSLTSAAVLAAVAFLVPLASRLAHVPVPEVAVQIVTGTIVGPQVLGWARVDEPVRVLSVLGLAFLLLLAGLEIDFDRLRGRVLGLTCGGYALSFALALAAAVPLYALDLVRSPLLIAVILSATSLGIVLPVLKDAGQIDTTFGQVVVAGASVAEVAPIVLLSLLFSRDASGTVSQVALLVAFLTAAAAVGGALFGIERSRRFTGTLLRLQDTTAEIRVRGAVALLMLLAALATRFGLESILGAFLAGATLKLVDRDQRMTHTLFRVKLQAVGFGVFIPFFFISTGMGLDVRSLIHSPSTLTKVPVFLVALLLVRGVPALVYLPLATGRRQIAAAGLLQATNLSIPVVAGSIGVDLGLIRPANNVALTAAGLLSVILFPLLALPHLRPRAAQRHPVQSFGPPEDA